MTRFTTLLVVQWFAPEPVHVPLSIGRELRRQGQHVDVLTGVPNYPDGLVPDGYRSWRPSSEILDGLRVQRTPLYPSHDSSAVRRALNYLSWAITSTILGAGALRRSDVALVYSSPATAALAPAAWQRLTGTPYVLLIQDLWPDSVVSSSLVKHSLVARTAERLLSRFVAWTYRGAAHVIVISPGMTDVLASRGVAREKISLVYNWAPDEDAPARTDDRKQCRAELGIAADAFVVSYAGNQGTVQGLDTVIESAVMLQHDRSITFVFAGDGTEAGALMQQASDAGIDNVLFLGRLDAEQMGTLHRASDVQLVSLIDQELFAVTMPSKIQSILAAGKPLIVMAPGDAAAVVRESGAGWAVRPGDASDLAGTVLEAQASTAEQLDAMSASAREYYRRTMSRSIGGARLDLILRRAAGFADDTTDGEIRG